MLVGAVCLVVPASASAITYTTGRLTYVLKDAHVPASTQASRSVRCPSGTEVTGGGAYTSGSTVDDEVATSAPLDAGDRDRIPDDGWQAELNTGAALAHIVTAYAICAPFSHLSYVRESTPVGPNGSKTVHAACPEGTEPIGGGARTTSSSTAVALRETFPWNRPGSDISWDGWQGTANNLTGSAKKVTAIAICKHVTAANYGVSGSFSGTTGLLQTADQTLACNGSFHVSGGGSFISAGTQGEVASTLPWDGNDFDDAPDDVWKTYFNNETGTTQVAHGTEAFCVK
jgi:hypothetical protein